MGVTSAAAATPPCGDDDGNSNDGNFVFHCDDDKMDSESKNISSIQWQWRMPLLLSSWRTDARASFPESF